MWDFVFFLSSEKYSWGEKVDMEEKERSERKKSESKLAAGRESTRAVSKKLEGR